MLLRPGALGINVAATGVEFEELVLAMESGVAIVNADSVDFLREI